MRGSGTGAFRRPITYLSGSNPRSLNLADVNNDGTTDIALVSDVNFSTRASVMLGQGGGAFQLHTSYDLDTAVHAVTVGDFNNDGRLDLAAAGHHSSASKFAILLGNGDGTFAYGQQYTSFSPFDITPADFNGDGILDLVVANLDKNVGIWQGTGDGSFFAVWGVTAGNHLKAVESADLNADSAIDLIVSNTTEATIDVFLGNGDGSLGSAVRYPGGANPSRAAVRDLTGDGILDLAVPNNAPGNGTISILTGIGGGAFHSAVSNFDTGGVPSGLAATEFNGDGDPDLVTSSSFGTLNVLPGAPGVNFGPKSSTYGGYFARAVAVEDLNNDGVPDVSAAVTGPGGVTVTMGKSDGTLESAPVMLTDLYSIVVADFDGDGNGDVASMTGNGDGSFQSPLASQVSNGVRDLAVGDFNEDGRPDLVFGQRQSGPEPAKAVVLLNVGGGAFASPISYPIAESPWAVGVGDFDSDGHADVAIACPGGGGMQILMGNGDGTLQSAVSYAAGDSAISVTIGDFNGDTFLDIAACDMDNATIEILLGNGDGSFLAPISHIAGTRPYSAARDDMDGDGDLDLVVFDQDAAVNVLLGNGDGTFQSLTGYTAFANSMNGIVADFDGDGILDIAAGSGAGGQDEEIASVVVYRGKGDGTFLPPVHYLAGTGPLDFAVGNLNGDGRPDLAITNMQAGTLGVLLNSDSGFAATTGYNAGVQVSAVVTGDFNADGNHDLAVTNDLSNGTVQIILAEGGGRFSTSPTAYTVSPEPFGVAAGDFDMDGTLDLAVTSSVGTNISILIGNGDGTFKPAVFYATGAAAVGVIAADLDGDGDLDLAMANYLTAGIVTIVKGRGDGTFLPPQIYAVGSNPTWLAAGDINGDDIIDLVVTNRSGGTVSLLVGNGDATFQSAIHYAVGLTPGVVILVDANEDGWLDMAVAHASGVAVVVNAADWPPLPIGDVPGSVVPLDAPHLTASFRSVSTTEQTPVGHGMPHVNQSETAMPPRSKYASRHIARAPLTESTDSMFDMSSTELT